MTQIYLLERIFGHEVHGQIGSAYLGEAGKTDEIYTIVRKWEEAYDTGEAASWAILHKQLEAIGLSYTEFTIVVL